MDEGWRCILSGDFPAPVFSSVNQYKNPDLAFLTSDDLVQFNQFLPFSSFLYQIKKISKTVFHLYKGKKILYGAPIFVAPSEIYIFFFLGGGGCPKCPSSYHNAWFIGYPVSCYISSDIYDHQIPPYKSTQDVWYIYTKYSMSALHKFL